jgi:hypothetical protein
MKKQAKDLKHSNSHFKTGTNGNDSKVSNKENKKEVTDQPSLKIIEDDFEFDSTPFSSFEDLTGIVKNEG